MNDDALVALGLHFPDLSEELRAEMIRTAESNPNATREDFIADIARHFAAQIEPEVPDHPEHVDCADGCGLAVTHQGACLDHPGGRVVCDESNHQEEYDHSRAKEDARNVITAEDEAALITYFNTPEGRQAAKALSAASHETEDEQYERRILQVMDENRDQPGFDRASAIAAIDSQDGNWTPVTSSDGATYTPWTDGWAVGFHVTFDDDRLAEYVYLNPSSESDDGKNTVFVYQGDAGDPGTDEPFIHAVVGELLEPLWTCPGCNTQYNESDADMIVDHVRDCDRVDGTGQRR